jgi:predicted P-loop ATPase
MDWMPVDDRVMKGMTMKARLGGINAWDNDVKRYVQSDMIKPFDPIDDFLSRAAEAWDGLTDHIGQLARTVPCQVAQWEVWFRKWLLYMVAQWLGMTRQYGNSMVPLLISEQGNNKSTFCRRLLPDCLEWGYNDNLLVSEKKTTLQAMSQFLLINLDEFNQIPEKIQEGFLKNVIQLSRVKIKRPYGKHVEDFPRLASFIATTNEHSVLADPSGNRRFIGVELTGPIDVSQPIDYLGLYGQAVTLLRHGEQYWLDSAEVRELMTHNRQFQILSPAEQWFYECFDTATDESEGEWLTCAAIYNRLKRYAGSGFSGNLNHFGRVLSNMKGLRQRRSNIGKCYLVRSK